MTPISNVLYENIPYENIEKNLADMRAFLNNPACQKVNAVSNVILSQPTLSKSCICFHAKMTAKEFHLEMWKAAFLADFDSIKKALKEHEDRISTVPFERSPIVGHWSIIWMLAKAKQWKLISDILCLRATTDCSLRPDGVTQLSLDEQDEVAATRCYIRMSAISWAYLYGQDPLARQMVASAKLLRKPRVMIFDQPAAAITAADIFVDEGV